ncbi:MAG: PAS domain S-box protein, partial [Gammaproteobacteria bacterium]
MIQLSPELAFLAGTGEVGALIGALDWSATSLGPIDAWPATVRTVVSMVLRSPVPIVTLWGEDGFMLYNAAYSVVAGERHPHLLGMPVRAGWPEVADFNDHVMRTGLAGQTLAYTDQELTLYRNGAPEQVWLNLDYSPITDDCGRPVGVMALVAETTSKVLAQRQLRNEHEKLATMFEQAPGFMAMLTGPDHVFTLHNKAYADLVGHRPVLGKPVREALPEVAPQGFVTLLDQLFVSGEAYRGSAIPVSLEATEAAPERQVFVDFVYQPLRDAAGDVFGIFVQGSDVTDRVLAERAMHESQLNFQTLAQTMLNHVWTAGPDGTPDWCNDRVYEYTGMTPDQFDVAGWRDTAHPDDLAAADRRWEVSLRTGAVYEMEFRLRDRHGHYRWHLGRAAPVRGRDGAVHRWIGTSTDIHNQKVASELLAESNQTLGQQVALRTAERDRMWTLSTDIMLVADARSIIKAVNPAVLAATGWDPGEMVGQSFFDFVHPDDHDATRAAVAVHDGARPAFRVENRCLCKSGEYRRFAWTGAPDGQFIYAVGRDTTAEHAAVETARKAEMALRQAQKMDAIGKLTGGVAHDFNNLLQVISGNLQLIAADVADNPTAQVRLQNALGGVARGAKLAGYLLAFGRRQALEPKVVRISRTVSGMEDMLARALGEECHIEIAAQAGLWNTFVDPAQVENAVLNLCINARDAMAGRGRLRISVDNVELDEASVQDQAEVTPGQYVQIAVQDDGCGMSPEVLAQAFEPFFSTKEVGKGTGLGLSTVYGIVKQTGGFIYADSRPGATVFRIFLPRYQT